MNKQIINNIYRH